MSRRRTDEPPTQQSKQAVDVSNLVSTRTANAGSAYEKAIAKDTEGYNTPSYGSLKPQKFEEKAMSEAEAVEFIQRVAGVNKKTAVEMNEAIWKWTNGAYYNIRAVQQGKKDDAKYKKYGDDIEKFIDRAAKWGGGTTYRGIDIKDPNYAIGEKINMKGTSSWSTHENIAKSFSSGNVVFVSPTQSRGTSTNFSHQHHLEHEVTVSKKASYVIERKENKNGFTYYYLRED